MLVRYDCGCIGLPPEGDDVAKNAMVIVQCDGSSYDNGSDFAVSYRQMADKDHEPIDLDQERRIWKRLREYVRDGERMREVQSLLAVSK